MRLEITGLLGVEGVGLKVSYDVWGFRVLVCALARKGAYVRRYFSRVVSGD